MTPQIVSVDEAKLYLRVEHGEEDTLIYDMIEVATEAVCEYADKFDPETDEVPARIRLAILAHVAQAYDCGDIDQPAAAQSLTRPMRTLDV
jgi:uncharacterized phage protein (predicted DNA packaging)